MHSQRSPYGAGAWAQIRYATSLCIEMGLHRKRKGRILSTEQARQAELRRRIFYTCYCFDRSTSIVLGRPFAISDSDINVEVISQWSVSDSAKLIQIVAKCRCSILDAHSQRTTWPDTSSMVKCATIHTYNQPGSNSFKNSQSGLSARQRRTGWRLRRTCQIISETGNDQG